MTAATIARAAQDSQLIDRVRALANKEIVYSEALAATAFGKRLRTGWADMSPLMWPVAIDTEAAYETAVNTGRGAPGHDVDVITDAALTSAIVAHWPYEEGEGP